MYQHFVREGRKVALLVAGLPSNVSSLVSNKTVSFLRRAEMMPLGRIDDFDIEEAFRKTIKESGRTISAADLAKATEAIAGFPFMMQLIGFHACEERPEEKAISSQVSQYRRRLIDAGVIGERRRGVVGFDRPFFREHLEEL